VAAHQVEYSRNVAEATVHAAVDAVRLLGAPGATDWPTRCCAGSSPSAYRSSPVWMPLLPARTAHPAWLVEQVAAAWPGMPGHTGGQQRPSTHDVRVDALSLGRAAYVTELARAELTRIRYSGLHMQSL